MGTPPKTGMEIITPNNHDDADGIIFGLPARFGMMETQFKAFQNLLGIYEKHNLEMENLHESSTVLRLKAVVRKLL
ncbi:hypothetical protein MKX03_000016, partial [Papaver bracteatum]